VTITVHVYFNGEEVSGIPDLLASIHQQGVDLMALSAAQAAKLEALKATIDTATAGLRSDIQALKDAITPGADPAVDAAFAAIEARLAPLVALDAENPAGGPPPIDGL